MKSGYRSGCGSGLGEQESEKASHLATLVGSLLVLHVLEPKGDVENHAGPHGHLAFRVERHTTLLELNALQVPNRAFQNHVSVMEGAVAQLRLRKVDIERDLATIEKRRGGGEGNTPCQIRSSW